ncbi:MAG TPA: UDP-2,3-diacylglucosamine diphosphatase LpxI [Caulobacteraceae bacterium]|nr:UDP-2,3-diacylglucosamine diphosphatase LpxI [Caulobacteraceae bacterium]
MRQPRAAAEPRKLGLVAGGGDLPVQLAEHCAAAARPLFVVRLPDARPELARFEGVDLKIGQVGAAVEALARAGCGRVCLAGNVGRPDFGRLRPDAAGLRMLPGAIAAAARGDDALLSFLIRGFEKAGFAVEGADEVMGGLLLAPGALGRRRPRKIDRRDIETASAAARAIGGLDIGQAAVACRGVVLALEAQEGTDAMLARVAALPEQVRGRPGKAAGALVKRSKPTQERRVDLPTIGPATIDLAHAAGLAGIAGEAGAVLVLHKDEVRRRADDLGLFVFGIP